VGVGNNVNVWSSPWLPDHLSPYVQTPRIQGLEDLSVMSLRTSASGPWDEALIRDVFCTRDADLF
jgi:hypothetical protein